MLTPEAQHNLREVLAEIERKQDALETQSAAAADLDPPAVDVVTGCLVADASLVNAKVAALIALGGGAS